MRRFTVLCCVAVLAACAKKDQPPAADSSAMMTPPAATMADLAGKWNFQTKREGSDSVLLTYELNATADTSGWTITFPGRDPIPVRVVAAMAGDSVVTEAGPYESALRKGVQVWTHNVFHLESGSLRGTSVAHYAVNTADSVVNLTSTGTKAP
jgi:hypothetical protein